MAGEFFYVFGKCFCLTIPSTGSGTERAVRDFFTFTRKKFFNNYFLWFVDDFIEEGKLDEIDYESGSSKADEGECETGVW